MNNFLTNNQLGVKALAFIFALLVIIAAFSFKLFFLSQFLSAKDLIEYLVILAVVMISVSIWKKMVPDTTMREKHKNIALNILTVLIVSMIALFMLSMILMVSLILLGIV